MQPGSGEAVVDSGNVIVTGRRSRPNIPPTPLRVSARYTRMQA